MAKVSLKSVFAKYGDIIKEEVNIKEFGMLDSDIKITKIFKPLGAKLSDKFGKDTGKIIQYGKQGNIKELADGKISIFDNEGNQWELGKDEYEIGYEGIQGDDMAIEGEIIAKMDLNITPELQREGLVREISRFLNQMRKDADYKVDDKVSLFYDTKEKYLEDILLDFADTLKKEALLKDVSKSLGKPEGDIVSLFVYDGKNVEFALKR